MPTEPAWPFGIRHREQGEDVIKPFGLKLCLDVTNAMGCEFQCLASLPDASQTTHIRVVSDKPIMGRGTPNVVFAQALGPPRYSNTNPQDIDVATSVTTRRPCGRARDREIPWGNG